MKNYWTKPTCDYDKVVRDYLVTKNMRIAGRMNKISHERVRQIVKAKGLAGIKKKMTPPKIEKLKHVPPTHCIRCSKGFTKKNYHGGKGLCRSCYKSDYDKKRNFMSQKKYYWSHRKQSLNRYHRYYESHKEKLKAYMKTYRLRRIQRVTNSTIEGGENCNGAENR